MAVALATIARPAGNVKIEAMKRRTFLAVALAFSSAPSAGAAGMPASSNSLTVRIDDTETVVTRKIARNLLLRVVKDRSVDCERFGWIIEVVRLPHRESSPNLLYSNPGGHGADPSQVYAWHVAEHHFPDERRLRVRGYPYVVTLALGDPSIRGQGESACFDAATLTVSWERTR
jgi:hypothetical protein